MASLYTMPAILLSEVDFVDGTTYSPQGSVAKTLALIVVFAIVIAVCYFTTRFIAGKERDKTQNENIRILDVVRLDGNKTLQIVKMGEHYIGIATSKENVTKLCDLSEEEITVRESKDLPGFKDIMSRMQKLNKEEANEESLEKQLPEDSEE